MRFLAAFIMQGRMQAIAVAATSLMLALLLPPLSLLSAAVVALMTLRMGWREGLNALLAAALAAGLLGAIVLGNFVFPALYGLILWLPMWAVALLLRQSRDLGLTLELMTCLGVAAVLLAYSVHPDPAGFWFDRMQLLFGHLWSQAGLDPQSLQAQIQVVARYMTGVMAAGMVSSLVLSLLWARWWQAVLYNPGGFREEFLGLRLHSPLAYFTLALTAVALVFGGQWQEGLVNGLLVLFVLYVALGTAILHAILTARGQKWWLYGMYFLMLFIPHVFLPIALVGFLDTWFDWRARFVPLDKPV